MHTELVRYCKRECPRQVPEPAALTGSGLSCPDAQGLLPAPPRDKEPTPSRPSRARQQSLCVRVPPQPRTRNPGRRLRPDSALSPRALRLGLPSRRQRRPPRPPRGARVLPAAPGTGQGQRLRPRAGAAPPRENSSHTTCQVRAAAGGAHRLRVGALAGGPRRAAAPGWAPGAGRLLAERTAGLSPPAARCVHTNPGGRRGEARRRRPNLPASG